jgi:hypothetical protein
MITTTAGSIHSGAIATPRCGKRSIKSRNSLKADLAAALENLMDRKVALEDEVAAVLYLPKTLPLDALCSDTLTMSGLALRRYVS